MYESSPAKLALAKLPFHINGLIVSLFSNLNSVVAWVYSVHRTCSNCVSFFCHTFLLLCVWKNLCCIGHTTIVMQNAIL